MPQDEVETMSSEQGAAFEALLDHIRDARGFDLTAYKRTTLSRRIRRRMQTIGVENYDAYREYLKSHPDEYVDLFNTVLINVTAFFRDTEAWDYLRSETLPKILERRGNDRDIRVWCAGVSSGEEAYGIAIAFAELLGFDSLFDRVKIYATDVDQDALQQARHASYTARQIEGLHPDLIAKYFEHVNGRYIVRKELRRLVIFGHHDLVRDPPISRLDLLVCRNTLMYFTPDTQHRILTGFHFALRDHGFLFLGKAEMLLANSTLFRAADLKWRVFERIPQSSYRDRLLTLAQYPTDISTRSQLREDLRGRDVLRLQERAFAASPVAELVIDVSGFVVLANDLARFVFGVSETDIGRPFHDLQISYRPVELRSLIDRVREERQPALERGVPWRRGEDGTNYYDILVTPLLGARAELVGIAISFTDVTSYTLLEDDLQRSKEELETTLEELQATVEELETTNEELQSTNEELETTNEELQSTNEELETMNEELQSANEELETMNDELRQRTGELNEVNAFMESIVSSIRMAVVVVDRDMTIHVWNRQAEDLWGLRSEEVVGDHILNVDIGLKVDELRQPIRRTLAGEERDIELTIPAINRRGRPVEVKVMLSPLLSAAGSIRGAVILMDTTDSSEPNVQAKSPLA